MQVGYLLLMTAADSSPDWDLLSEEAEAHPDHDCSRAEYKREQVVRTSEPIPCALSTDSWCYWTISEVWE